MRRKTLLLAAATSVCLAAASLAAASETLTLRAGFTPDELGVPTNASFAGTFASSTASVPSPVTSLAFYLPAGTALDTRGAGSCTAAVLEAHGPGACPASSRAGFGGGVGVFQLAGETIHERFALDLFFAPERPGQVAILAYLLGSSPVTIEVLLHARQIQAPAPYGLGLVAQIPPIQTLPGASPAAIESAFLTLGAPDVDYFERRHGKRSLVHIKGVIVPRTCPHGGFPIAATAGFADGGSSTVKTSIACPRR
ncbi:MAG TPA: hypothetical protein VGY13_00685 [Solirubrobacteraceae bacterium]|jgi:hypothetical protein|nr:hypothetical protein [Solirubrobacteraceae bacterium]